MSAHRYWRINVTAVQFALNVSIAELQLRTSVGGSTVTGSGTASASTVLDGYPASNAFDGNASTWWNSTTTGIPQWLEYDFGSGNAFDIVEIALTIRSDDLTEAPTIFTIQYSDNGSFTDGTPSGIIILPPWATMGATVVIDPSWTDYAPHNMTSDTAPSPYVASASAEYGGYEAYRAFDGVIDQYAIISGTTGWLQLDLGSAQVVGSYAIQANNIPEPARCPNTWTLQGSSVSDFSSYTTLDSQSGQASWGSGEKRSFTISSPASFRYYRINVTANNGDSSYIDFGEVYLYAPPIYMLTPNTASFTVTEYPLYYSATYTLTPSSANFAVTAHSVNLSFGYSLAPEAAVFTVTTFPVDMETGTVPTGQSYIVLQHPGLTFEGIISDLGTLNIAAQLAALFLEGYQQALLNAQLPKLSFTGIIEGSGSFGVKALVPLLQFVGVIQEGNASPLILATIVPGLSFLGHVDLHASLTVAAKLASLMLSGDVPSRFLDEAILRYSRWDWVEYFDLTGTLTIQAQNPSLSLTDSGAKGSMNIAVKNPGLSFTRG